MILYIDQQDAVALEELRMLNNTIAKCFYNRNRFGRAKLTKAKQNL